MNRLSRRSFLAASCAIPVQAQDRTGSSPGLALVIAPENIRLGQTVIDDIQLQQGIRLPVETVRHEMVPWIGSDLAEEMLAGPLLFDAVLTNVAGFALGAAQDLWETLPAALFETSTPLLTPTGQMVQANIGIGGLVIGTAPGGPVLLHRRSVLPSAPRSAADLLEYARQNPRRFQYARPGQSRFGQAFVAAMPFLLRDRAPLDPQNGWNRTWEYLLELGRFANYYPSSGQAVAEEFAEGGVDLCPVMLPAYLFGMAGGFLPPDTLCSLFDDAPLVPNSLILAVPRGVPAERLPLLSPLASYLLGPGAQRQLFGRGLIPGGPARDIAPATATQPGTSQFDADRLWMTAMTPELAAALTGRETAPPLNPYAQAYMIRAWDGRIGARYGEVP
ncbi:hypothetical protein [Sediminicoccus sp. KRV36]|uniref:hypothetical protein n=1 Tax=Sediminicoccus sp. KRV36 TaxID=3133721 RepID=UPI00201023A9|nr:hypothetical protein [Sediminicoccus rosea]UPY38291.1 hypothetical protein LHU95_06220 [Sediminicoccus rosea]